MPAENQAPTNDPATDPDIELARRIDQKYGLDRPSRKRPGPGEEGDEARGDDEAAGSGTLPPPALPGTPTDRRPPKRAGQDAAPPRRVQPDRRGEKRSTETAIHPEDPRGNDTDTPDISLVGAYERKCGCCDEEFESRNMLFEHLRRSQHAVVSDDEEEPTLDDVQAEAKRRWIPGTQVTSKHIRPKDLEWRDIGSGTVAKTFKGVTRLWTSTKRGPAIEDISMRRVWSLSRGVLIDECDVEQTPDRVLNRQLSEPDDIRVELVLKGAQDLYLRAKPDVAEIYSNPRVCQEATARKYDGTLLRPGWSLDLSTRDPTTGEPWNLADAKVQSRVRKLIMDTEPFCIVGSPPCTPFSQLQGLNKARRDPKIVEKELRAGKADIKFCLEVYTMQMKAGRHFVHEHPLGSTAWKMPEVLRFILENGVDSVATNM